MDSDKDYFPYSINLADLEDTLTVSSVSAPSSGYGGTDTITLGSSIMLGSNTVANGGVSLTSPYTFTGAIGSGFSNATYTTSAAGTSTPWFTQNPSTRISLSGEDADVEVNGWSLVAAVKRIEQRLGLFQPNPELEAEWSDLRELGEQYKKLEQHILDKQATWDRIKAMPAPDVE
jgi:hypothetical protein